MSIPGDSLSTEQPGTALVLVAHREGVIEPVLDVMVPQEGALVVNINVAQTSRVHDRLDRVGLVQEHDLASAGSVIVPAVLKGLDDRRRRVGAVGPGLDDAHVAGGGGRDLREDEGQLERRRGKGLAHCERHDEEGLAAERSHLALSARESSCPFISGRIVNFGNEYTAHGSAMSSLGKPFLGSGGCVQWGSPRYLCRSRLPLDMYPLFRCGSGRQLNGTWDN